MAASSNRFTDCNGHCDFMVTKSGSIEGWLSGIDNTYPKEGEQP